MKFIKVFVPVLIMCFLFTFFGGWGLFDFGGGIYVTAAVVSLMLALIIYAFLMQNDKIERLEKRVKELEANNR